MKGLNPRQERFIAEYLKDGNGTQAAIRAGYSESGAEVMAFRLLRNAKIEAKLEQFRNRTEAKIEFSVTKHLQRLVELVELTTEDFEKPRDQWTPEMKRWAFEDEPQAVRSADGEQKGESKSWDYGPSRIRIRVADKLKALELIGRHKAVDAFVKLKEEQHLHLHVTEKVAERLAQGRLRLLKSSVA